MKLTYRGVQYDHNPLVLALTKSDLTTKYRGQSLTYSYVRNVPIPQPAETLCYRGVAYQTNRYGQLQPLTDSTAAATANTGTALSRLRSKLTAGSAAAQVRRELLQESSNLHQSSIRQALERRIEVAKAQNNQPLLAQLESEMRQTA